MHLAVSFLCYIELAETVQPKGHKFGGDFRLLQFFLCNPFFYFFLFCFRLGQLCLQRLGDHTTKDGIDSICNGCFVLRKNCEAIRALGTQVEFITATGGGAKSSVWCQLQADITGIPIRIPKEKEAACFGAAIIGAVADGIIASLDLAIEKVSFVQEYLPHPKPILEHKFKQFLYLYEASLALYSIS